MARKEPVLTEMERTAPELAKRGRMSWCYDAPTPPLLSIPQRWPSLHLIEAPRCRISLDLTRILRAHSCARSTEPLLTPVLGFSPRRPSHHAYLSRITSDPATGLVSALSCAIVRSVHRRTTCPDIQVHRLEPERHLICRKTQHCTLFKIAQLEKKRPYAASRL